MLGGQWFLLCVLDVSDASSVSATLAAIECGVVEQIGQGGVSSQGRVGLLILASSGEIPLVLAIVRRVCRRYPPARMTQGAAAMLNLPTYAAEEATILALPVRNATRWALGDLPRADVAQRREWMLDTTIIDDEADVTSCTPAMKLLVAVVPDRAADAALTALARHRLQGIVTGSTGGLFRRGRTTIVVDVPAERAQLAAEAIRAACSARHDPAVPEQGIAFALDVAWHVRF